MRDDKRQARMQEIETCAYALFAELGFEGTSLLTVAKKAKASNETMYRWYGNKNGLFESMVRTNAAQSRVLLENALKRDDPPLEALTKLSPVLLGMLLGERAILLNRAAASDPSGMLGQLLAKGGREDVLPLIETVMNEIIKAGIIHPPKGEKAGALYLRLLLGDAQIRRVIGTLPVPSDTEITHRAAQAVRLFLKLCRF